MACEECDGRGVVLDAPDRVLDGRPYWTACPTCGGSGLAPLTPDEVDALRTLAQALVKKIQRDGLLSARDELRCLRKLLDGE